MPTQSARFPASAFQDVLVIVVDTRQDEAALAAAERVCAGGAGRVTALLAIPFPDSALMSDGYAGPMVWGPAIAELNKLADADLERLKLRAARMAAPVEVRSTEPQTFTTRQIAAVSARHADLTVLTRPEEGAHFRWQMFDAAAFDAGRPVLVVPPGWSAPGEFKNVVVAWDGSREAARALGDAAPFLQDASVTIVTVDGEPRLMGWGDAPGADIAAHLARKGVKVSVRNLNSGGRGASACIREAAADVGADLIVLGAYGHSRVREMVFGGVTRDLLAASETPLFMSH